MAVARKKKVDSSAKGGWFRRRRSQLANSKLSVSNDSTNVPEKTQINSLVSPATGVSHRGSKQQPSKNRSVSKTSIPPSNTRQLSRQNKSKLPTNLNQSGAKFNVSSEQEIPVMSSAMATMPVWLLRFCSLQRYTSVLSFLLVVATLIAYGYTVYSQQLWSKSYRRLQELQRNERQLTITNNALKSKIASEAENKSTGLVSPSPASQIFLPAARDSKPNNVPTTVNTPNVTQNSTLIGY
jgi:hypothetical protein